MRKPVDMINVWCMYFYCSYIIHFVVAVYKFCMLIMYNCVYTSKALCFIVGTVFRTMFNASVSTRLKLQ